MKNFKFQISNFKLVLYLLLVTCYLLLVTPVYASEDIAPSAIHPASPLYFLKAFKEIMELKGAKSSHQKGLRYLEFAQRRIKESKALINSNRPDLVPPVLERFSSYLNKVSSYYNFKELKPAAEAVEQMASHISELQSQQNQTDNQRAKIALRAALFRIWQWQQSLAERLSPQIKAELSLKIAASQALICDFLSKEASSSALTETETYVLIIRSEKCFNSLESLSLQ